ncbi:unnamed protein product [Colias eurytheme]|nr:unnamed protein product [Colias eurytheme]
MDLFCRFSNKESARSGNASGVAFGPCSWSHPIEARPTLTHVYNKEPPVLDTQVASQCGANSARISLDVLSIADVRKALTRLKPKRSAGPDGIPAFIFKDCARVLAEPLLHIFNTCLNANEATSGDPIPWCSRVTLRLGGGGRAAEARARRRSASARRPAMSAARLSVCLLLLALAAAAAPAPRVRRQLADDDALQPIDESGDEQAREKRKLEGVTQAKFGVKNAVLGFVFGTRLVENLDKKNIELNKQYGIEAPQNGLASLTSVVGQVIGPKLQFLAPKLQAASGLLGGLSSGSSGSAGGGSGSGSGLGSILSLVTSLSGSSSGGGAGVSVGGTVETIDSDEDDS